MTLLLTGATGFVGLNLLLAALRSGHYSHVTAAIRDPGKLRAQLAGEGIAFDQVEIIGWGAVPPDRPWDHAVHCAGVLFARDRASYFRVNVDESLVFLRSLSAETRLVVLSSQSAGGPTPVGQLTRTSDDPDSPLTWYGESKLALEQALRALRPDALVLRPPMILGARDSATLPLFRMARSPVRVKPGLAAKTFSWIAVDDLVRSILRAFTLPDWKALTAVPVYAAAPDPLTDEDLIRIAAGLEGRSGFSLPLAGPLLRLASRIVDGVPALRAGAPSLTRDRVREIFADRWVVDASCFQFHLTDGSFAGLDETLAAARDWYVKTGQLDGPGRER